MGVRGLTKLLERYSSAFPRVEIEGDLFVDGNNWAHACCDQEGSPHFEYEDVDNAMRSWLARIGGPSRVTFVFDGVDDEGNKKAATRASRAEARGSRSASFVYEGARQAGPMVVDQAISTLVQLGISLVLVDGEADVELARLARQREGSYVVSDDSDFALCAGVKLLRLSTFEPPTGVVWTRESIAEVLFGDATKGERCVELALALGTDGLAEQRSVSADEALGRIVRAFDQDPDFRISGGEELQTERERYEGMAKVAVRDLSLRLPDAPSSALDLGTRALQACSFDDAGGEGYYYNVAIQRILRGERVAPSNGIAPEQATFADRDAARQYEYRCRDLLRHFAPSSIQPIDLFHASSFFGFCRRQEKEKVASCSDLSAAAPVFNPTFASTPSNLFALSADDDEDKSPPTASDQTPLFSQDAAVEAEGAENQWQPQAAEAYHPHAYPPEEILEAHSSEDPLTTRHYDLDLACEALETHVTRLEDIIIALGHRPPPRPSLFVSPDQRLPVDDYRSEIVSASRESRVVIIRGETGSGKSSVVPRFLLESNARAKIVVTQPRRLAATQLYERARASGLPAGLRLGMAGSAAVAEDDVGTLGLVGQNESDVRLWYMTAGVAAKLLSHKPRFWDDVTHLLVDEVHERDADTDVVLALSRERLRRGRRSFRVILLSATLDSNLLANYFQAYDPPLVDIPGRRFNLERFYLEDIGANDVLGGAWMPPNVARSRDEINRITTRIDPEATVPRAVVSAQLDLMEWLVRALAAGTATGFCARAVMIFVAGWSDVANVAERFEKLSTPTTVYEIVPIHSELPFETQRAALVAKNSYDSTTHIVRVIVATNAAESSLTLPDVDAVVDLCSRKLPAYDSASDRIVLRHTWSSKATMAQRAGRTGRVGFGVAYHLVSRGLSRRMIERDPPQVKSQPLDQVVLGLRSSLRGRRVAPLMREFPSPPSSTQIADAFVLLLRRGLVESETFDKSMSCVEAIETLDAASLTPAGELAAALPVDLRLSRLVMFGAAVGVLDDAIILAAALSQPSPPWTVPLPLPQLYADVADFLVLARKSLLGKKYFDRGDYSEPLALLRVVKEWRDLQSVSDRSVFCATFSLSASRLRQLDDYAKSLKARVGRCCHEAAWEKIEAEGSSIADTPHDTIVRLLLTWVFWDQAAFLEMPVDAMTPEDDDKHHAESAVVFGSYQPASSSSGTGGAALGAAKSKQQQQQRPDPLVRSQLAPLFPPVVPWKLVETRQLEYHAINVRECVSVRALTKSDQDELLRRFDQFAASHDVNSYTALFAQERLVLRVDGELVFDGPAPLRDSQLWSRVDSCGVKCRFTTGIGWATVNLVVEELLDASLKELFGTDAKWRAVESRQLQQSLSFPENNAFSSSQSQSSPPPNICSIGEQLVAGAVLASSAVKRHRRVLRLPTPERSGAIEVSIAKGRITKRPEWRLVTSVSGIEAHAALAPLSLEAVYWPGAPRAVAVAASMTLFAAEGPQATKEAPANPEEQTRARLDGVSVLPSLEWMSLALRAGGLKRASANLLRQGHALPEHLFEAADVIANELLESVDSGHALRELKLGVDLRCRLEQLFVREHFDVGKEARTEGVVAGQSIRKKQDALSDLAKHLATPHRGDEITTPWGTGVARIARGDGSYVVHIKSWNATCYGVRLDSSTKLAARRKESKVAERSPARPSAPVTMHVQSPVEVVAPSRRSSSPPTTPPAFVDEDEKPLVAKTSKAAASSENDADRASLKQWILQRSSSQTTIRNVEEKESAKPPAEPPENRLLAVLARNPALCSERPQLIVQNAERYVGSADPIEMTRVIVFAVVSATSIEHILKSPSPLSMPLGVLAERFGQTVLIDGLVRYCAMNAPGLVAKFPLVLKALYDDDCLDDEEAILKWACQENGASSSAATYLAENENAVARQARVASEPFVTWLREAEEEEDDD